MTNKKPKYSRNYDDPEVFGDFLQKQKKQKWLKIISVGPKIIFKILNFSKEYGQMLLLFFSAFEARAWRQQLTSIQTDATEVSQNMDQKLKNLEKKIEDSLRPNFWNDYIKPAMVNIAANSARHLSVQILMNQFSKPERNQLKLENTQLTKEVEKKDNQITQLNNQIEKDQESKNSYHSKLKAYANQNEDIRRYAHRLEDEVDPLRNKVAALRKNSHEDQKQIQNLKEQLSEMKSQISEMKSQKRTNFISRFLARHTIATTGELVKFRFTRPTSEQQETYRVEKMRAKDAQRQRVKNMKKYREKIAHTTTSVRDKIVDTTTSVSDKAKKALKQTKKFIQKESKKQNKKNEKIVSYGVYGAHHSYDPNNKDGINNKYGTVIDKPRWTTWLWGGRKVK